MPCRLTQWNSEPCCVYKHNQLKITSSPWQLIPPCLVFSKINVWNLTNLPSCYIYKHILQWHCLWFTHLLNNPGPGTYYLCALIFFPLNFSKCFVLCCHVYNIFVASDIQQNDMYIYSPFQIFSIIGFYIKYSSLCYTINPCFLSFYI